MDAHRPRRLKAVRFRWRAPFGYFQRGEASVAGFTYPLPPRTAVLGLLGSVLGLAKDELAHTLSAAEVAVAGRLPATHWHRANLRKTPPSPLPYRVKAGGNSDRKTAPERNTQMRQEWLLEPDYEVVAALPAPHHDELAARLRDERTHFVPCMGLSEMIASLAWIADEELELLPPGLHQLRGAVRQREGTALLPSEILAAGLQVVSFAMPSEVSADRRFRHTTYFVERLDRPLPCSTDCAWCSERGAFVFL